MTNHELGVGVGPEERKLFCSLKERRKYAHKCSHNVRIWPAWWACSTLERDVSHENHGYISHTAENGHLRRRNRSSPSLAEATSPALTTYNCCFTNGPSAQTQIWPKLQVFGLTSLGLFWSECRHFLHLLILRGVPNSWKHALTKAAVSRIVLEVPGL